MSNVSKFSSKDEIHEEACLWISRIDRGLSAEEAESLQQWMAASQSHRRILFELAQLWDDLSVLNELKGLFPLKTSHKGDTLKARKILRHARWSVAAGFILMAAAALMMVDSQWFGRNDNGYALVQRVGTAIGEQKTLTLDDGSVIHLNTNSAIHISYNDVQRKIDLIKGEAHFTVAHDATRPFTVNAGANSVTAIGTAFNMQYTHDDVFELVVTEGRVLVQDKQASITREEIADVITHRTASHAARLVDAGEKAKVAGTVNDRQSLDDSAMEQDLAWQQGMIVFKGEPLEDALREIERYTAVDFEIQGDSLKQKRVAGYFKVGDISGLLFALKNSFNIEHKRLDPMTIQLSERDAGGDA
ncbi:FecR domain-containing protein [Aestuariibacter sp. A3R04]|uniref:FecR family protein n=1 Tax=Aestuariibacter sp. A3R04 TaxID=2841571 RepID=UPI001C096D1C|nr:FecR domain-containing protein [Aestuariibacter sp. A3R04]MBU3022354.1 FecR domain-containing protein [Aestuariibacter sp. A3R04]